MTPPIAPPATYEYELGKEQANAAAAAGVEHIVFSSLENVDDITGGIKWAPHFTDKARVEAYIRGLPVTSSFVQLAFFYTNLLEYYFPRKDGDTLVFPIYLPEDFRAPFVDPLTATGPAVVEIFDHPSRYAGQTLPIVGDVISPREIVDTFARLTGLKVAYASAFGRDKLLKHFPAFGGNDAFVRELVDMAEYAVEYGYFRKERDLSWSRRIDRGSVTWEQFLHRTNWQGQALNFGMS